MQEPQPQHTDLPNTSPLKDATAPKKPQSEQGGVVEPGQTDLSQGAGPKTNTALPG